MKNKFYKPTKVKAEEILPISVSDHAAYVWYRENSEHCNRKDVENWIDYRKTIRSFYEIASDMLVNSKGGMYIDNFGYFGFMKYRGNFTRTNFFKPAQSSKLLTADDIYYTVFIPISKNKRALTYLFDRAYKKVFLNKLTKKLKEGYHYMFNASLFFKYKKSQKSILSKL
jgi:hypothetical protein